MNTTCYRINNRIVLEISENNLIDLIENNNRYSGMVMVDREKLLCYYTERLSLVDTRGSEIHELLEDIAFTAAESGKGADFKLETYLWD